MAQESLVQKSQSPSTMSSSKSGSRHPVHKTLVSAANLANLLPTGTVLAFQALIPSFSNGGSCHVPHKYLTASVIACCSMCCFLSSFTDSFKGCNNGKLYYGIATFKGLYIFNYDIGEEKMHMRELAKFRIGPIDFVHAFVSLIVFLTFAFSNSDVLGCYFSDDAKSTTTMLSMNLPIGAGVLSSFLFTIFPTTRRGIGYSDVGPRE